MKMVVRHCFPGFEMRAYPYPMEYEAKLFAGGVLKIIEPATYKVPAMGTDEKEIVVEPEYLIAIFHSNYIVTYEED